MKSSKIDGGAGAGSILHPFHPACRVYRLNRLLVGIWRYHGQGEADKAIALVAAVEIALGYQLSCMDIDPPQPHPGQPDKAWQPSTINSQPSSVQ